MAVREASLSSGYGRRGYGRVDHRVVPTVTQPAPTEDTDHAGEATDRRRRLDIVAVVAALVVGIDQATKHWAVNRLPRGPIEVVGSLRLNLRFNPGAAFSIGSGGKFGPWIALVAIVVVAILALGYPSRFRLGAVAAGLITGGAVGNLLDRAFRGDAGFLHGSVVDFIDLGWWPVFNVADAAVSTGAVLLVFVTLREP